MLLIEEKIMTNPQLNVASTNWLNDGRKQAYNLFHSHGRVHGPINVCVCACGRGLGSNL